jgi:hypothetical protein
MRRKAFQISLMLPLSFLVGHGLFVNFIFILVRNAKLSNLSNMNFFAAINVSTYTKDS